MHTAAYPRLSPLCTALALILSLPLSVYAEEAVEFDLGALANYGLDSKVAEWYSRGARFTPGPQRVTLFVNGINRGSHEVTFTPQGELQVDAALLKNAGLRVQQGPHDSLQSLWPQAEIALEPDSQIVRLVVPSDALDPEADRDDNWQQNGSAGLINYAAQYMGSAGRGAGTRYYQLNSEAGFNAGNWIVRSRQNFSQMNGRDQFLHQGAYAQRTLQNQKKVLQLGQISLFNSLFGSGTVLGFQLTPEDALLNNEGGAGIVSGIASSQSVVEVRQSGAPIYSTVVPAGPFSLTGLRLLNNSSDLDVTVTGSDGETQQFIVPAASFIRNALNIVPGTSFGMGKVEQQGSGEAPLIATAATGWNLTPYHTLNLGLMTSQPYIAGGASLNSQFKDGTLMSLTARLAQDKRHAAQGGRVEALVSRNLSERLSASANLSQQTQGYSELSDALQTAARDSQSNNQRQYGGSLGWSQRSLGSLSLSWSRSQSFNGERSDSAGLGWSKQLGNFYLGANAQQSSSARYGSEQRFFLTLSGNFNQRSFSSYVNSGNNSTRNGVRYSERYDRDRGWSLSADRENRSGSTSVTGNVDMLTSVSQLSGNLSRSNNGNSSWSGRASGGVALHGGGVTLTPYSIGDTFAIARVGEESGIRLDTPGGPTWTDGRGYAVISSVPGFRSGTIQIDTRSLAKNIDVGNGVIESRAARGSVSRYDFGVIRTRRALLSVREQNGAPLPSGAAVFNTQGEFVTVIGNKGELFLSQAEPNMQLDVERSDNSYCRVSVTLPERAEADTLYEESEAVCG